MSYKYGEWITDDTLYYNRKHRKYVYTVQNYPQWVLKVCRLKESDGSENIQELPLLVHMRSSPIRNSIRQPDEIRDAWGFTEDEFWYAMRRCEGHIDPSRHLTRWREVARCVLEFLCDLHRNHGLLHMDIKKENVLDTGASFVVSDYELVTRPRSAATCELSTYDRWYYMRYGAEWKEPVRCWRMDLTMVGYLLAEITWDSANNNEWSFRRECNAHMEEDEDAVYYEDVIKLRASEMSRVHPDVLRYFAAIEEVPWTPWISPPSAAFYDRLMKIFTHPPMYPPPPPPPQHQCPALPPEPKVSAPTGQS
jgi:hypothetical protein